MIARESAHDFGVVTRSRDLGDSQDYPNVVKGSWIEVAGNRIAYVKSALILPVIFPRLWREFRPDTLYLTSVHDVWFTWVPLVLSKLKVLKPVSIVVSPTGEFSEAALSHHPLRKNLARRFMRELFRQEMSWHVASLEESKQVLSWWNNSLPSTHRIVVQPDVGLEPSTSTSPGSRGVPPTVVFASRIHPIKGLAEAVDLLRCVKSPCTFRVYGSVEDARYWQEVQVKAAELPPHIAFHYAGGYSPEQVPQILGSADLFLLLTRGEGFGHAISEALAVGCPPLLSAKSMWTELVNKIGGLASESTQEQLDFLEAILTESAASRIARRHRIHAGYAEWFDSVHDIPGPFQVP